MAAPVPVSSLQPTRGRLARAIGISAVVHLIVVLLVMFDVLGLGGGGGGLGWSLGSSFGKYVGGLRKGGLDVAIVVDATGSMQNIIDDLKRRLTDVTRTMQRLVPTARIGAVAYRDRDTGNIA